jgi:hypothetical protein
MTTFYKKKKKEIYRALTATILESFNLFNHVNRSCSYIYYVL